MRYQREKVTTPKSSSFKGSFRLVLPDVEEIFECPVCGYLFRDDKDFESYHDKNACTFCVDTYYYINADRWNAGWRPDRKEVTKNGF